MTHQEAAERGWISPRRPTKQVRVGSVIVGGTAPVSVQGMTKSDTRDVRTTLDQIRGMEMLGCDIVRVAVVDIDAAKALTSIIREVKTPIVADIHFDYKLALASLEAGAHGLRINPGNIGGIERVSEVVRAARERDIPIRIGVNGGSLEKDVLDKHGTASPEAMVESALRHIRILEDLDYHEIKISVKASDARRTVEAYRLLSSRTSHPLHLGVTEAGTFLAGTVRSVTALGMLLSEGIGDTIRVSLTDSPAREIRVGLELLRSLGLRKGGATVISCPTCGRIQVDVVSVAGKIEQELEEYYLDCPEAPKPLIAVMGCMVNGPGEAREADLALAGGKGKFALYLRGEHIATVSEKDAVESLMEQVKIWRPKV